MRPDGGVPTGVPAADCRVGRSVRTPRGITVSEIAYAPGRRQRTHAHPGVSLTLVLRGSVLERAGRREEIGRALSVVLKPEGVEHADRYGERGLDTVQIALSAASSSLQRLPRAALAWRWSHGGAVAASFLEVVRALRETPCAGERLEWAVLDTFAALGGELDGRSRDRPPGWLERARRLMDESAPGALTVDRVAGEVGVHPVSLTRAFRRFYGVTTSRYLRRVRVRHAAGLLADTRQPLSRIAYASGFSDQSHMTRHTRVETGVTPGALRRLVRGGPGGV